MAYFDVVMKEWHLNKKLNGALLWKLKMMLCTYIVCHKHVKVGQMVRNKLSFKIRLNFIQFWGKTKSYKHSPLFLII